MNIKKYLSGLLSFGLLFSSSLYAEELPVFIQFVRPLGMGGAFTAVADDHNVFTYNPAGMVQRTGAQTTILELAVGASQDFKDATDFVKDNEDDLTNFENLSSARQSQLVNEISRTISKLNPRLYAASDIASFVSGPKFFGIPIHGGLGAFGSVDASFKLESGLIPSISYQINNDLLFPLSIAKRWEAPWIIPGKMGVGLTGKIIRRNQVSQNRLSVLQLDDLETPPVQSGVGFGSDLGFLFQPNDRFNIGLMVQDFLGTKIKYDSLAAEKGFAAQPERDTVIRPRTNLGFAVVPKKLFWLLPTSDRWTLAFDVRDILTDNEHVMFERGLNKPLGKNFWTHMHMGAEFRYWFLRFRGGASQGYPTAGLGLDIPILKIDYAFYSRELGELAGDIREENHIISLALRFGSGATESRERIKNAQGKGNVVPTTGEDVSPQLDQVIESPK
ncbi:MAG: hypothetical protein ACKVQC_10060 [Elusimicrobiota bacterium]